MVSFLLLISTASQTQLAKVNVKYLKNIDNNNCLNESIQHR